MNSLKIKLIITFYVKHLLFYLIYLKIHTLVKKEEEKF